ncbi:hypothetical protein [Streptomyces sp. A3M-1-3]|uniref:hypothetical protein n=1 Tax=Streptomyces sp. A3M-1-3 TaxID=2962044 RepID=UPI0026601C38|nr:hypothetical protein [Streptomyces sp. A3M-1-3]
MRPSRDTQVGHFSHTPIYDALYSEYRRSFRALPGDRSGEEDLRFTAFGIGVHGGPSSHGGSWHSAAWHSGGHSGHGSHSGHSGGAGHGATGNSGGRQHHTGSHLPAALPPAPRRGL